MDNIFSKQNVLIAAGGFLILGIGTVVWYRNKQSALFDAIWKEIDSPSDPASAGITGTSADVFSSDFWQPSYLNTHSAPTIDSNTATRYNQQIYAAKGLSLLPDDEPSAIAVFQKLGNRSDIAYMASLWAFGDTLLNFMETPGFLDNTGELFSDRHNYVDDLANAIKNLPA